MKLGRLCSLFAALVLVAAVLPVSAEIYEYLDDSGTVNFTDDPTKIPKKYQKKKKNRSAGTGEPGGSGPRSSSVQIRGNQVIVPVTIGYQGREVTANLLLDTGASNTTVTPALAERLRLDPGQAEFGLAQVAGGGTYVVGSLKVQFIDVGPRRVESIQVSVIESPYDGLLGMNFLRNFKYHVDFDRYQIVWE